MKEKARAIATEKPKAKKVFTMYGTYYNVVTYEYRGRRYDVEYPVCMNSCCTSPRIQHKEAQERIDKELAQANKISNEKPFDLDEVFRSMGWD